MDRINFNKLYYFYVVAKEGSVKSASKKLHLTQPTISSQIRQLEEELGFEVFIRKHRKLELNRNGRFVLKKAEKLFNLADELVSSLPARGQAERIKIRIGAIQSLSNSFIYDFSLKLWREESIMISISQGSMTDLIRKMDRNELDIILSDGPYAKSKKYKSISLGQDKIVAVGGKDLTFNKRGFPQSLSELPYLAFSNQGRLQEDVDYFFNRENIQPERIGEVDDVTLMRVITENSQCFSILPHRAVKESLDHKKLKVLGEIQQIQSGLWAIVPSLAANRNLIRKIIKDYFTRKK
jgi:LysR family transcriptional activator of nhaA